ncbi:MAG: LysE family transporter [Candidatus Heimdallarchaeota archaeon]|nr:MAG: LysE family transporter [Candidatus Heimdallarchaeota archaeon]
MDDFFLINFLLTWVFVGFLGFTLAAPIGPINAEIIKQVLNKSIAEKLAWGAAVFTGFGAMTGDFIVAFTFLTIGEEVMTDVFSDPSIRLVLLSVNILILGFLGISTLLTKAQSFEEFEVQNNNQNKTEKYRRLMRQYLIGLSLVVTSPWSYLWWVSAGTTYIILSDLNNPDLLSRLVLIAMFLSGVFLWMITFSSVLYYIGRFPDPKWLLWITRGTAIILLIFAGFMVINAWEALIEIISVQ